MAAKPVVLVTGAAGGIGSEIVRILLEELHACVVATDVVHGKLLDLRESYPDRLAIELGDIFDSKTSETCVKTALSRFGPLTGLCLNAGVFGPCYSMGDAPVEKWERAFQINALSHLYTLKYAIPELRKTKGRVTATTSGAGLAPLFTGWGCYGMTKAAVSFMIRQLSLEEPDIISVGISPGLCNTRMVDVLLTEHDGWGPEQVAKYKTFVSGVDLISPMVAGNVYAQTVVQADSGLSGLVVDYDDPRLPIADHLKRKEVDKPIDYRVYSVETNSS